MKRFLIKFLIFSILFLAINVVLAFFADGTTDNFYKKLSSPKYNSLVIGTSRAYNGIRPSIINKELGIENTSKKLYNFAFTLNNSPYGAVYNNSILSKLKKDKVKGIFILSVIPWSISKLKLDSIEKHDKLSVLYDLEKVSGHPNYEYLLEKYSNGWGNIILKRAENTSLNEIKDKLNNFSGSWTEVENDGWLKVNSTISPKSLENKIKNNFIAYSKYAELSIFSNYRYKSLIDLINDLNKRGEVYLVRLPIHSSLVEIEKKYMPDFNEKIEMAIDLSNGYFDFSKESNNFEYTDGNHLTEKSANEISVEIANLILKKKD